MEAISATEAALAELIRLRAAHGSLMLFQSGGCCSVGAVPFYIDADHYRRWNNQVFEFDVAGGAAAGFSLEGLDGVHFITRTPRCTVR